MKNITLDNLTFVGGAVTRGWMFSDLKDWRGQVDDKVDVTERPQNRGAFTSSRSVRSSRAISFHAGFSGASPSEVDAAFDELSAVGAEGPVRMAVTDDDGSTSWRMVKVRSVPVVDNHERHFGECDVHVIATDPRRYASGEWVSTPPPSPGQGEVWPEVYPVVWPGGGSTGRVELKNGGRAPSPPVFRVVGPTPSALITCVDNGLRVGLDRPVPAGQFVDIDFGTGRALLDGLTDVSRWLLFRQWVEVPGLMSRTFQYDGADGSLMFGKVDSAWW